MMRSPVWHRQLTRLDGPNILAVLQGAATLMLVPPLLLLEGWRGLSPWRHPNWRAALSSLDEAGVRVTKCRPRPLDREPALPPLTFVLL